MEDWLKVAVCYWHSFNWPGQDIFGGDTLPRPWLGTAISQEMANTKLEAAFDFFKRLGVPYFAFHDVDAMATATTLKEHANNVKKIEICTVAPRALGVSTADFDITRQMAAFFSKMAPQGTGPTFEVGTMETVGFSGVPVRSLGYSSKGDVIYASEITDIAHQNFAASSYAVPAGFQKTIFGGRGAKP